VLLASSVLVSQQTAYSFTQSEPSRVPTHVSLFPSSASRDAIEDSKPFQKESGTGSEGKIIYDGPQDVAIIG
jgi:hypothetical protein